MADDSVFRLKYNDTISSLSQAAIIGDIKTVKALLKKGRLPQATDNRGWSVVHSCVAAKQLEALKIILNFRKSSKKYLTNLSTWENESPLVIALSQDSVSFEIVTLLLKYGSNPNTATNEGMTPLHYACKKNGNSDIVRLLIKHGAKVDSKECINEYTPLHFAIVEGADIDTIKILVEECDVNLPDADNETPLYKASVCNFFEAVELILKKDTSSVNVIPRNRFSPISAAVLNGNLRLVKLLYDVGANVEIFGSGNFHRYPLNDENTLPIHLSVHYPNVFKFLLKVTNPYVLLNHEKVNYFAIYTMMYGPGSECFKILYNSQLSEELKILQTVNSDTVIDFIIDLPYFYHDIIEKFRLLFKYCIHLDAEIMLKRIASTINNFEMIKLYDKLPFIQLLAKIGVSSVNAFESKNQIILLLKEREEKKEIFEVIQLLSQPILTLMQMSRIAVRQLITSYMGNSWTAYTTIKDLHLPNSLKEYLWCQS